MTRRLPRAKATREKILTPLREHCEQCGQVLWVADHNHRTITTLSGMWKLISVIYQCNQPGCPNYHRRQHPEEEGGWALPHSTFGLDIIFFTGLQHVYDGRRGSEIHQALKEHKIFTVQHNITNLIHRYQELEAGPTERLKTKLRPQGHVILAFDIYVLQFQKDIRILGAIRDCLSAESLWVRLLRSRSEEGSSSEKNLETLLSETRLLPSLKTLLSETRLLPKRLGIPVKGFIFNSNATVINPTQLVSQNTSTSVRLLIDADTIRRLVLSAFPTVSPQLCQFQYFTESPQSL